MEHMPPVLDVVKRAYFDLRDVYEQLRAQVIMAFVLTLGVSAVAFFLSGLGSDFLAILVHILVNVAFAFVIAPYLIAVHRFIILGEITQRYDLVPDDSRFRRYFGWMLVLSLLWAAPAILTSILPFGFLRSLLSFALAIGVLVVTLRIILVLPAVAVDADRVTWQDAMADTNGYALRIFLIGLAAVLPVVAAAMIVAGIFASLGFVLFVLVAVLAEGAAACIIVSLLVVISSRIYEWLADRVRA